MCVLSDDACLCVCVCVRACVDFLLGAVCAACITQAGGQGVYGCVPPE